MLHVLLLQLSAGAAIVLVSIVLSAYPVGGFIINLSAVSSATFAASDFSTDGYWLYSLFMCTARSFNNMFASSYCNRSTIGSWVFLHSILELPLFEIGGKARHLHYRIFTKTYHRYNVHS